ncbi:undecaprenyldiphospho-muramoylpentapeptide beta-N-acetylglucosaminyltransferase [Bdellovibrionota bacterium FG-2]
MQNPPKLMVAGGGTGGHILAGVAIAQEWRKQTHESAPILFVGCKNGIEERLVPKSGFPLELLSLGSLNQVSLGKKLKTLSQLPGALLKSFRILRREKPACVVGVGGYASGPVVLMAWVLGIPRAIVEQNSIPGITNRILGRFVKTVFCAFPGTEGCFPNANVFVTGNPIRLDMQPLPQAPREPFTVFIFGGSQGALGINTLVLDALSFLIDLKPRLRIIHQTGERDFERVKKGHEKTGFNSKVEKFIYEMRDAYASASLLICRAGSSTLSEIAAVGRAAILVPFPFASDNHQEKNARVFSDPAAAILMTQKGASGEDLARVIRTFIEEPKKLEALEEGVRKFYRPFAARDIVKELLTELDSIPTRKVTSA